VPEEAAEEAEHTRPTIIKRFRSPPLPAWDSSILDRRSTIKRHRGTGSGLTIVAVKWAKVKKKGSSHLVNRLLYCSKTCREPELVRSTASNSFTHRLLPNRAFLGPWSRGHVLDLGTDFGAEFPISALLWILSCVTYSSRPSLITNLYIRVAGLHGATPTLNLLSSICLHGRLVATDCNALHTGTHAWRANG
jgi:hypothetical protein